MVDVAKNIAELRGSLPAGVGLVAVSKFHPVEALMAAYGAGQRVFGESRAQELAEKAPLMPPDVEWHFIGHLQTNKVRAVVPLVKMIHSIDSERLLLAVNDEARRIGRRVDVLLELRVALEETKFGLTADECRRMLAGLSLPDLPGVRLRGVMGMATNTDDEAEIRREFREIKAAFCSIKDSLADAGGDFTEISMGMSDDYRIAVEEGSTMVRVGSHIFGERQY